MRVGMHEMHALRVRYFFHAKDAFFLRILHLTSPPLLIY